MSYVLLRWEIEEAMVLQGEEGGNLGSVKDAVGDLVSEAAGDVAASLMDLSRREGRDREGIGGRERYGRETQTSEQGDRRPDLSNT